MFRPIETVMSDRQLAESKRRQQLRQSRPELRQLESQLRLAYVEKERAAQRAEKKLQLLHNRREQEQQLELERVQQVEWAEQEAREEREKELERIRYQRHLDMQLEEKQREREAALKSFLEEKRQVDEVIQRVKREQRERALDDIMAKEERKVIVREFIEAQKTFAKLEKERLDEENKKIAVFLSEKEEWIRHQKEMEALRKQNKSDTIMKMAEEIQRQQQEDLEREAIMHELYEGRQRDEDRRRELQEMETEIRKRMLVKESNEAAVELKRRKREQEARQEDEWRQKMMAEFAENDRLELLSNERRRRKQAEHRREIELLLEERREARRREELEEADFWKEHRAQEEALDRVVEEERRKLLRAHAEKLIGYLPGGVITEKDLDYLGEDVRKSFRVRAPPRDPLQELEDLYITKDPNKRNKFD